MRVVRGNSRSFAVRQGKSGISEGESPSKSDMNEVQNEAVLCGRPTIVKVAGVRASRPPETESCALSGGIGSEVENEKDNRNRTINVKRRQGTLWTARRSRTLLKLFSLEREIHAGGEVVAKTQPNMTIAANGKDMVNLPGSKRVVCRERDDRNPGDPSASLRPLDKSGRKGRFDQRKKASQRVLPARGRGDSDHPIVVRGKTKRAQARSDPTRPKEVTGQRSSHSETYPGEKGPESRKGPIHRMLI